MSGESPAVILYDSNGVELNVSDGVLIPVGTKAILVAGKDSSSNARFIKLDTTNNLIIAGPGIAGTPSGGVLSVQGVTSGTVIPISGTVNQGSPNTIPNSWFVSMTDGSAILGTSANPVRIDPTGTTTQPISATSLPLPSGAATEATLLTRLADATFTSRINTLGQKTSANSTPVVIASDQSTLPIKTEVQLDYDSGGGTQLLSIIGLALPASGGAVAGGTLTDPIRIDPTGTTTQPVSGIGNFNIIGTGTAGTPATGVVTIQGITSGTPVPISGSITATNPSVSLNNATMPTSSTQIGGTDGVDLQAVRVFDLDTDATTEYNLGVSLRKPALGGSVVFGTLTDPIRIDTTGTTTQPVSGTVTANIGTTNGLALDVTLAKLTINQGTALGANTQALIGGSVTTSPPAYTNGNINPISLTTSGLLRVDGSNVTQPVSGTGTDNTTNSTAKLPVISARANTAAPTWTDGNMVPLSVDTAGALRITGTVVSSANPSVSTNNAAAPGSSTQVGGSDGTNLQAVRVYDTDTGAGTEYTLGVSLRKSASGGSVLFGTSTDPIRIDPTGTTSQPVIQATASNLNAQVVGNVASGNAVSGNPVRIGGSDGTNVRDILTDTSGRQIIVGAAANGAAVSGNPNLIAGYDGTNARTIRTLSDGTVINRAKEYATFTALATSTAPANNKSMFSIVNASGSAVLARIQEIYLINVQTSSVTGVAINFELRRITNHSAGTAITAIETMDTSDALSSSITVRTNGTITGESTTLLWRNIWSSDEWGPGTADVESNDHTIQTMFPILSKKTTDSKSILLRAAEGLTIKCATNTTVGTFDLLIVFTQE